MPDETYWKSSVVSTHGLLIRLVAPAMSQVIDCDMALVDHGLESMQIATPMTKLEMREWCLERDDPKCRCLMTFRSNY